MILVNWVRLWLKFELWTELRLGQNPFYFLFILIALSGFPGCSVGGSVDLKNLLKDLVAPQDPTQGIEIESFSPSLASVNVKNGSSQEFTFQAKSNLPVSYSWRLNGQSVSSANQYLFSRPLKIQRFAVVKVFKEKFVC
jgi:hypothetical protein